MRPFHHRSGTPEDCDEDRFRDLALILFDQAALAEGEAPEDAAGYVQRLNRLLLELMDG